MSSEAQAQARWTFSIFMIVLATSIPFVVTGVDPLLLSLNLPAIRQDLGIPSDLVGFTGSVATLVMAAAVLRCGQPGRPVRSQAPADLRAYRQHRLPGAHRVFADLPVPDRHALPRRPSPDGPARAVTGAPDSCSAGCDPSGRHRPLFGRLHDLHRHHAAGQWPHGR